MKIQGIISAAVLSFSAALSTSAFACSPESSFIVSTLSNQPGEITDISCGNYEFAGANSNQEPWTADRWKLFATQDMTASLSVFYQEITPEEPTENLYTAKIFDTKNLSFTIFDDDAGQFLGWGGNGETLSGLTLQAGKWYTLKVYGEFGSPYRGSLETCVTEVPLGATAPLLGSALGLLVLRRKRVSADTNA